MTGEITLRGRVLPIGGLKEKLLAAMRGGIRTVIIPEENRKDLADMPKTVTQGMKIVPVRWIDEVLDLALERPLTPDAVADGVKATIEDAGARRRPSRRAAGRQALISIRRFVGKSTRECAETRASIGFPSCVPKMPLV